MTARTPADRHRASACRGARRSCRRAGRLHPYRRRGRRPRASPTITACVIRSRSRKPTVGRDFRRSRPRRPFRCAARRRDGAGDRPGCTKAPARSSPTSRSTRRTRGAAADSFREIQALLAAGGVPPRGIMLHRYHPEDPRAIAAIRLSYPRIVGGRRPLRPVARGSRALDQEQELLREQVVLQFRLRLSAQHGGDDRQSVGPRAAAAPKPRPIRRGATEAFEKYRKGNTDLDHLSRSRQGQTQRYRQMISYARQNPEDQPDGAAAAADDHIAPAPRVSVQAFCETVETAAAVQSAGEDRRLGKAHLKIQMGGMAAAIEAYRTAPTPNVIILETEGRSDILTGLDQLATRLRCRHPRRRDRPRQRHRALPRTGAPRRQRLRHRAGQRAGRGALDLRPVLGAGSQGRSAASSPSSAPRAASARPPSPTTSPGRSRATWRWIPSSPISTSPSAPPASTTTRIRRRASPTRCSRPTASIPRFIDRLLSKCTDHLSLLAAPATLERVYDFGADAFDSIFDTLRITMPCIVLDVPHQWSGWTKRALVGADDILIVAAPDLANLRNTKNIFDLLKASRPNDRPPLYCLNQVGMPKRPEINAGEFAKAIESPPIAVDSVRSADVRRGGQQRPDDRGNLRQSPHHRDIPADRAAADRPWRDQKAAGFVPVAPDREAAGKVAARMEYRRVW